MNDQLKTFLRGLLHALTDLRINPRDGDGSVHHWAKWGGIEGRIWLALDLDLITLDQACALQDLRSNASMHQGKPFPHKANVGPVMPFIVAFERRQAAVKPHAQVPETVVELAESEPKKGWGRPYRAKRSHWFVNGLSICNRWLYSGPVYDRGLSTRSDACAVCGRLLAVKPQAQVPADESRPVSAPTSRPGLRLLCLLCRKTGAYQPVATLRPMPPRTLFPGRWPNATGERALAAREQYVPLGLGLYLSPALTNPAPVLILVRGGEHRQANALRPALGSVRVGELRHAD